MLNREKSLKHKTKTSCLNKLYENTLKKDNKVVITVEIEIKEHEDSKREDKERLITSKERIEKQETQT